MDEEAGVGPTLVLDGFDEIRAALQSPALSRTFDRRTYGEGNIRAGIVSVSHGEEHRRRRRLENPQFRRDRLARYERELFPAACARILAAVPDGRTVDLVRVAGRLNMTISTVRTGIDHDGSDVALDRLVELVLVFSLGSAILDLRGDRDEVADLVRAAYDDFDREFFGASYAARADLAGLPDDAEDVLGAVIGARLPRDLALRECAIYLQGGTTTSSHTVCSVFDLIWTSGDPEGALARLREDVAFAQRCVHETLRLRPTTPVIRRHVEEPTEVAGRTLVPGDLVLLDVRRAHRDTDRFGPDSDRFDPDRTPAPGIARWGLAFGAGSHQCIGRTAAAGQGGSEATAGDGGLMGLMAHQLVAIARRGIRPDPVERPRLDDATDRGSRWATFPVVLGPS